MGDKPQGREASGHGIARRRMCLAWAFAVAASVALAFACVLSDAAESEAGASAGDGDAVWEQLKQGSTEEEALDAAGFPIAQETPAWFRAEVQDQAWQVRYATEGWDIVRVDVPSCAGDPAEQMIASLEGKGWSQVESGCEGVATFVKTKGSCSWLMVEWMPYTDGISAVMRILHD